MINSRPIARKLDMLSMWLTCGETKTALPVNK